MNIDITNYQIKTIVFLSVYILFMVVKVHFYSIKCNVFVKIIISI